MKYPLQLDISNPCDEDWNLMQPSGMGRNCAYCQKTVIDFTCWSDVALYEFFANNNTRVCGRFLKTQLGKPIGVPHQPHSRLYQMTVAMGLALIFTQAPEVMAQNRPPKVPQTMVQDRKKENKPDSTSTWRIVKQHKNVTDRSSGPVWTGEVEERWVKQMDTPVMKAVVVPPSIAPAKSGHDSNELKMDINNPTKTVIKR